MSKQYKILQTSLCLNPEVFVDKNLVLVFMINDEIESIHIVSIPDWLVFRDPKYKYHTICFN